MIKDLMTLLKVDESTAAKVAYEMDCSGIDYSECTQRQFNRAAREALADLNAAAAEDVARSAAQS